MTQLTQVQSPPKTHLFASDPRASEPFLRSLFGSLFYLALTILCALFLSSGVRSWQQVNQQDFSAVPTAGISSLERVLGSDGSVNYWVTYHFSPLAADTPQAVLIQHERIPAALFYRLQINDQLPVSFTADTPTDLQIDPTIAGNPGSNHFIGLLMICLGALGFAASAILLLRSSVHTVQCYRLNRSGEMTYGVVLRHDLRTFEDREAEYSLVYQFQTGRNRQTVEYTQLVPFSRFRSTQNGEVVRVRYLPQVSHISRIEF